MNPHVGALDMLLSSSLCPMRWAGVLTQCAFPALRVTTDDRVGAAWWMKRTVAAVGQFPAAVMASVAPTVSTVSFTPRDN